MKSDNAPRRKRRFLTALAVTAAAALATGAYFFTNGHHGIRPAGPPEKVTIAYAAVTDAALAIVAQIQGYSRDEGLEVTARLHPYGKLALQDVLDGKADFATAAETPVMFAILKGEKVSIIATIETANQVNAIVARKDRGIHTPGDLRGRRIAVTLGTTMDYYLNASLAMQGISRKDVTLVDMNAEKMPEALALGDVEAISTSHPYNVFAQKELGDRGITFQDKDIYTATFNVLAKQEFIQKNPGKAVKMVRALLKAEEFVKRYPAEAQKIVADFSGMDIAVVREVWASQNFGVTLAQSLLLAMEDESRWAINNRLTGARAVPNYLDFIYVDGLKSVKPEAVTILR